MMEPPVQYFPQLPSKHYSSNTYSKCKRVCGFLPLNFNACIVPLLDYANSMKPKILTPTIGFAGFTRKAGEVSTIPSSMLST